MERLVTGALGAIVVTMIGFFAYDFIAQSMMAGKKPSEYTVTEWVDSFAERGRSAARQAELVAKMDGPLREYLPAAPSGWKRVEWSPEYLDQLKNRKPRQKSDEEREIMAAIEQEPSFKIAKALDSAAGKANDYKTARRSWVYLRGDQMIILQAQSKDLGLQARARRVADTLGMSHARDLSDRPLAAMHRGAAFYDLDPRSRDRSYRRMKAALGTGEIEIMVRTNAPQREVDKLLRRINYSALYALMGDEVEAQAMAQHHALRQQLSKDRFEKQYAAAKDRETVDRLLAAEVRRARGSGKSEVCIDYRAKKHCAWVQ